LKHAGTVSREDADRQAESQYALFQERRRRDLENRAEAEFAAGILELEKKVTKIATPRKRKKWDGERASGIGNFQQNEVNEDGIKHKSRKNWSGETGTGYFGCLPRTTRNTRNLTERELFYHGWTGMDLPAELRRMTQKGEQAGGQFF
jgi:hypothetical protein